MRLRSNGSLAWGQIEARVEIATHVDAGAIGYDACADSPFDIAEMPLSINEIIAYDRAGELVWSSDEWRTWIYDRVGLSPDDDATTQAGWEAFDLGSGELAVSWSVGAKQSVVKSAAQLPARRLYGPAFVTVSIAVAVLGAVSTIALGLAVTDAAPPPTATSVFRGGAVAPDAPGAVQTSAAATRKAVPDAQSNEAATSVPAYILASTSVVRGVGRVGDVVVSQPDAGESVAYRRRICHEIARAEGLAVVRLYKTADAYVATRDTGFRTDNPAELRSGFLGMLLPDGTFRTGRQLDWSTEVPPR